MKPQLIDVHSHALTPTMRKVLTGDDATPPDGGSSDGMPLPPWSVERHIEMMDANGIDVCVLSLPEASTLISGATARTKTRILNEELGGIVAAHPSRFGAMAIVPVDDIDAALKESDYALDVLGLDGVGLDTNNAGRYLGEPHFDPLLAELDRRKATVFVHPARPPSFDAQTNRLNVSVLEYMFETTRMIATLVMSGARRRFANLNIISTHGGGTIPYLATRISLVSQMPWAFRDGPQLTTEEVMEGLASFYFDLTAAASPTSLDALRRLVPADRLLMGFDFPLMPPATIAPAQKSFMGYAGFDEREKGKIRADNAIGLFPRLSGLR